MRLAERLSRVEPRRQGVLLQLRRRGERGGDQARAQGPPRGRDRVVHGAFHGRTYGALSATPQESKQAPFAPLVPGFRAVDPTPEALAGAVDEHTAAVLLEPIQGETGVNVLSDGAAARRARGLRRARRGADLRRDPDRDGPHRHALGLRADRRRARRDHRREGARRRAADRRARHRRALADVLAPGDHGSTFAGGPVVAAAALAALEVTEDPALLAACASSASGSRPAWRRCRTSLAVRGRGLMLACELDVPAPDARAPRAAGRAPDRERDRAHDAAAAAAARSSPTTQIETALARSGAALERGSSGSRLAIGARLRAGRSTSRASTWTGRCTPCHRRRVHCDSREPTVRSLERQSRLGRVTRSSRRVRRALASERRRRWTWR